MEYAKISVSLVTYWFESPIFLKEVTPDVVSAVP